MFFGSFCEKEPLSKKINGYFTFGKICNDVIDRMRGAASS